MKTKDELNALKNEVEALNKKLTELNENELEQVAGGFFTAPGIGIEKGECFEMNTTIFVYEGETTFLPITENITLDIYLKDPDPFCFECKFSGPTTIPAGALGGLKSLGNKGSIPYRLNK